MYTKRADALVKSHPPTLKKSEQFNYKHDLSNKYHIKKSSFNAASDKLFKKFVNPHLHLQDKVKLSKPYCTSTRHTQSHPIRYL